MINAIVINYRNMEVGGIENYIYQVIQHAIQEKFDIYWFCDIEPKISKIYKNILEKVKVIKCNTHGIHWFKHENIKFDEYKNVVVLSFSFFDHVRMLELKKRKSLYNIIPYYVIPHFTGGLIFPEQNFDIIKKYVRDIAAKQYEEWGGNGQLLFCANNHIDAIEKSYGFYIKDQYKRMVPSFENIRIFDEKLIRDNYRAETFTIISAGRFEFPHKGYVLGLIDDFMTLLSKYKNVRLWIVGGGTDQNIVEEKINSLPEKVRNCIKLYKMMPAEKLLDLYQKCNLSISVAGCASMGARVGLPTLPARHYTTKCEVYGFFPESKNLTTSIEPGHDVLPYIEKVINMKEDEYVNLAKAAYDSFEHKDGHTKEFIDMYNERSIVLPKWIDLIQIRIIYYIDKIAFYLKKWGN